MFLFDSSAFKNIRVLNNRTNLGNIYLEKKYIIIINNKKLYVTWLTKKNGISCGINKKIKKFKNKFINLLHKCLLNKRISNIKTYFLRKYLFLGYIYS